MTLEKVVSRYNEISRDLAKAVNIVADVRDTASWLESECHDNGDPKYRLDEALSKLASALAITVEYGKEYEDEMKKWGADAAAYDPGRED